jgi:signal transduction histidine kinase/ActR/RegA family two-component response regulator
MPALLVTIAFVSAGIDYWLLRLSAERDVRTNAAKAMRANQDQLQGTIEQLLRSDDIDGVRALVAQDAARPDHVLTALVDGGGHVVAATRFDWLGLERSLVPALAEFTDVISRVTKVAVPVSWDGAGERLVGAVRVCGPTESVEAGTCGALLGVDTKRVELARLDTRIVGETLRHSFVLLAGAALLWIVLHLVLTYRVARVVSAARRYAAGDHNARARLLGRDELAVIGQALDDSLDTIEAARRQLAGANAELEARVAERTKALAEAKAEAERANDLKSRFLAAASHDLRQPLQTINIVRSLLTRAAHDSASDSYLQLLGNAARSMDELLSSLLDINRLESGAIHPRIEDFALAPLFARLRSELGEVAASKRLTLTIEDCTHAVRSDANLISVILRNLVGNAIKYTPRGGVSVSCHPEGAMLKISVQDTGVGISNEHLERIFEEFYQVDNDHRDRRRGVGLGLSIVQRIAKTLGHSIDVESAPGRGTKFTLTVPRVELAGTASDTTGPSATQAPKSAARPFKLLHIEDDPAIAEAVAMLLKIEGYDVSSAESAAQALELLDTEGLRPDVIVSDYQLPAGATGVEVVRAIAARLGAKPPTILLTGDISQKTREDVAQIADRVLAKPVDTNLLLGSLRELTKDIH